MTENGNWNHNHPDKPPVIGKNIALIICDGYEMCLTDREILSLIRFHIGADTENTRKIKDTSINTGEVQYPEKSFISKVKNLIKDMEQTKLK